MYYFIGIKGSGMASLACILKDCGNEVSGSDIDKEIFIQKNLQEKGIPFYSFNKDNIKDGMNVIIGNAFDESNEEVAAALANPTVKTYTYPQFLGHLVDQYHSICVCGTHGKTGTTGLLSHVMSYVNPTGYLIGDGTGYMPQDGKNFVLESCEYKRNFLAYHPDYTLLLNIELDHVDYYKSMEDYLDAFETFANQAKCGVALFGDEENTHKLNVKTKHMFYGISEDNDVYAKNIVEDTNGVSFDCYINKELFGHFELPFFGMHLLYNALGVITIAYMNGMDADTLQLAMSTFGGVKRRFNIEENNENIYIDDYAHHPTAIKCTIDAAKQKYPNRKIIAVFKPDRYSRIAYFLKEFAPAFVGADEVYFCDFPDNQPKEEGIDVTVEDLRAQVEGSTIIKEDDDSAAMLAKKGPAVYVFMSSKDIYKLKNKMKNFQ